MEYLYRTEPIALFAAIRATGLWCAGGKRWGLEIDPRNGAKQIPRETAFAIARGDPAPPEQWMFACRLYVFHSQPLVKSGRWGEPTPHDIRPLTDREWLVVRFPETALSPFTHYPDGAFVAGHASYYVFPTFALNTPVVTPAQLEYLSWNGWQSACALPQIG